MRKLALTLLLTAVAALCADISGTWQFEVQTDQGSGSPTFVLKQAGEKLTGTYSGAFGKADVRGTVKGDDVVIEFDAAAGGETGTVRYTGKLEGDSKMKGKVSLAEFSGTFTGTKK